jgi:hypothetical protein
MATPPSPTPPNPAPLAVAPSTSWSEYLLRPGSVDRSTSLWWATPPVIAWICIAVGGLLAHAIDASPSLGTPILWVLLADLVATTVWMVLVVLSQSENDTEVGDGLIDPKGRHEFWRVRTVAWDILAVSVVGALLSAFLLAGPSAVLPTADVPLIELAVLVLTIVLLATFSRYAAMAFNTDAARMVQKLEELSIKESEARMQDTNRITRLFTEQTDRIVAKADAQIEATTEGLSAAIRQLDRVAQAIEDLTNIERDSKTATEVVAETQERAIAEQRSRDIERKAAEIRIATEHSNTIRPIIWVRLRIQGILNHKLMVDIYNDGFDGVGLEVEVSVARDQSSFTAAKLPSKTRQSFEVGDLTRFPLMAQIFVGAALRDVDGRLHKFGAGHYNYAREAGWLDWTKRVSISLRGWVTATIQA